MPAPAPLSEPATANTFGTAPEPSDRAPAIELLSAARMRTRAARMRTRAARAKTTGFRASAVSWHPRDQTSQ